MQPRTVVQLMGCPVIHCVPCEQSILLVLNDDSLNAVSPSLSFLTMPNLYVLISDQSARGFPLVMSRYSRM